MHGYYGPLRHRRVAPEDSRVPLLTAFGPASWTRVALTLLLAYAAARLCVWLGTPIPWMIGPLLATALTSVLGAPTESWAPLRNGGQWVIGTALGLTFTPEVGGLVAGLWAVNAFTETEIYYCMVAPVFISIGALVAATTLLSVPRAAIGAMGAAVLPILVKMALYDNLGVRAMAVMMAIVTVMQANLVLGKFRETVAMLVSQRDLARLAGTDVLTGLDNRLSFMRAIEGRVERGAAFSVLLADLDGFKQCNDQHGHQAGDALLTSLGGRLRALMPDAVSIARLGGDEFALLHDAETDVDALHRRMPGIRQAIAAPVGWQGRSLSVGSSFGIASFPQDGVDAAAVLHVADTRLYADKRQRKGRRLGEPQRQSA